MTNHKEYEHMLNTFRDEFLNGCDTLRMQKDFFQSHRSVFQYIIWFDAHWSRMIDERYGKRWGSEK